MQATADSKTVKVIGIGMHAIAARGVIVMMAFPSNVIRRWPAIRFAVNRTHKVIGRMMLLTVSIITMNIIKAPGVPWGTRWDNMWFVFLDHPNIISDNQNTNDKGNVVVRCEVGEKICG